MGLLDAHPAELRKSQEDVSSFSPSADALLDPKGCSTNEVVQTGLPLVSLIYIFAGKLRQSDVGGILREFADKGIIALHVLEIDLLRAPDHNVSNEVFWKSLLKRVRDREFKVVIATPPCNTHSRARHANGEGPPPIRSKQFPRGCPWLFGKGKEDADQANKFIEQTLEICFAAFESQAAYLIEHPEDLGRLQRVFLIWKR